AARDDRTNVPGEQQPRVRRAQLLCPARGGGCGGEGTASAGRGKYGRPTGGSCGSSGGERRASDALLGRGSPGAPARRGAGQAVQATGGQPGGDPGSVPGRRLARTDR